MRNDPTQSTGEAVSANIFTAEAYARRAARLQIALKLGQAPEIAECVQELRALRLDLLPAGLEACDTLLGSNPVVWALRRASMNHEHCPMWNALTELEAALARYEALPEDLPIEEELVIHEAMVGPLSDRLEFETPICTSSAGAALAMKLAADNLSHSVGGYGLLILAEATRYYERAEL